MGFDTILSDVSFYTLRCKSFSLQRLFHSFRQIVSIKHFKTDTQMGTGSPLSISCRFFFTPFLGFVELLLRGFVQMYSCEEKEDRNKVRLYLKTMERFYRSVSCVLRLRPKSVLVGKTGSTLSQSTYGWINASYKCSRVERTACCIYLPFKNYSPFITCFLVA